MYSVQGFEVKMERKLLPSLTKFYIPTQLLVALSWLAFFVPPEVISGRMVLLITILLMLVNIGKHSEQPIIYEQVENMSPANIKQVYPHFFVWINPANVIQFIGQLQIRMMLAGH